MNQPLVVDGWVVAHQGQTAYGHVVVAQKAKAPGQANSRLGLELSQLTLVDGQQVPVQTRLSQAYGSSNAPLKVATVGATTGVGAVIGAAAAGGEGAAIGAASGAAAGLIGVLLTPGKPTVIPPETALIFQLTSPLTISTVRSQVAFQSVTPQDYSPYGTNVPYPGTAVYSAQPQVAVVPPPYYWYGGYGWGYYPYYSYYPFFGFYGFYGPRYGVTPYRWYGVTPYRYGGFRYRGFRR
jgi:hypothetical protein